MTTESEGNEQKELHRVDDSEGVLEAIRQAGREAVWQHKMASNPVATWRDGKGPPPARFVPPEERNERESPDQAAKVSSDLGAELVAKELRKSVTKALKQARPRAGVDPWRLARPIAADIKPVVQALTRLVESGHAAEAEPVLRYLVERAEVAMAQIDDSHAQLYPLFQEAVSVWGRAWAQIEPRDTSALVRLVHDRLADNGCAICDGMIGKFAKALGRDGLLELRGLYAASESEHRATRGQKFHARMRLGEIADALGDVDAYIAAVRGGGREGARAGGRVTTHAIPIARRLLQAGRPAEALEQLDADDAPREHQYDEPFDYYTLRSMVLQALGRADDARATMWTAFKRTLDAAALDRALEMTDEGERQRELERALAVAEGFHEVHLAARFLVQRGELDRAANLIQARRAELEGRNYDLLLWVVEPLEPGHPAAAWVVYRALLLSILDGRRTTAYRHAADYFVVLQALAAKAGLAQEQRALEAALRKDHGLKRNFWQFVAEAGG